MPSVDKNTAPTAKEQAELFGYSGCDAGTGAI
jgi:hypothetical protein